MSGNEMKYIQEAFDTNWIAPLGANVDGFEKDLSGFLNIKHVAALSSGTSAIHLALIILGIEKGDEVLCSSFTFSATANPIIYQNTTPIFIDSEPDTWNMSPELLQEAIEDRIAKGKKPKAIILVHLYGMPAKIDEILEIAQKYNIPVIEDAAEALGSTYKGKACGTFGIMGILSFNGNKIITTSGGGALISDNKEYIEKARFLATQARDNAPHYEHTHIGYNYRMSNVLAGIGRGQMEVLNERIAKRRENFFKYKNFFNDYPQINPLEAPNKNFFSNHWLTTINIDTTDLKTNKTIREYLEKENIETRPLWKPMHLQPIFRKYPAYLNGVSEKLFNTGLCLPSGSNLSNQDFEHILYHLKKALNLSTTN
jgi:dTDP-4-amino-4,6-dideoxygalactose transaminase